MYLKLTSRKKLQSVISKIEKQKRQHSKSKYLQINKLKSAEYLESPKFTTYEKKAFIQTEKSDN